MMTRVALIVPSAALLLSFAAPQSKPAAVAGPPPVHIDGLGSVSFPTSGQAAAQPAFIRGVLLLHSFEYTPAAEAFRQAEAIDANFALAFWGEAMTYNHPL